MIGIGSRPRRSIRRPRAREADHRRDVRWTGFLTFGEQAPSAMREEVMQPIKTQEEL